MLTLATHLARRWCRWGGQRPRRTSRRRPGAARNAYAGDGGDALKVVKPVCRLLFWFLCAVKSSALKPFKLSSVRVASFRASIPPRCSATSDVGSGSSFIHLRLQHLKDLQQLTKRHFTDTTGFLGGTHQLKPQGFYMICFYMFFQSWDQFGRFSVTGYNDGAVARVAIG